MVSAEIVGWLMSALTRKRPIEACPEALRPVSPLRFKLRNWGSNHPLLADHEWIAIKPMLPSKLRGVPRVNDRRVLNGIFCVLRSEHLGVICPTRLVRIPTATTASSVGGRLERIIDDLPLRSPVFTERVAARG